ncbi:MAG: iron-sulfur cluster assembly accessory protein [Cytophagales bacterium]|nr:iron-sulfur cluster assembly accessory protein [Cytophagales bacterium]
MFLPIDITPKALEEIKHILNKKNIPSDYCLRVAVKGGGGCGGAQFVLGFDKEKPQDSVHSIDGIKVLIEKKDTMFLIGKVIDFHEDSESRGFYFRNSSDEEKQQ